MLTSLHHDGGKAQRKQPITNKSPVEDLTIMRAYVEQHKPKEWYRCTTVILSELHELSKDYFEKRKVAAEERTTGTGSLLSLHKEKNR